MAGTVKNVKDYKFALIFYSQSDKRTEVELFRSEESRAARRANLVAAGIPSSDAHINRTY